ncbi:LacI family DNA-binding transcriptional regulator [Paenibacillus phoenicis]|uniref:LacI family DNA-binding transcriptional regulator n=1 Tax=Paenibacillus phoenicis TaxID=554117 RepID=A0ABU5PGK3_9BACL|nr:MULTISPECIES: LacI family DNA-binding transcriptional regulator [Paenibacillus]MCT2196340.1 LacI family transcriptional regulator [Paenibacillus sp. p3-SID1389]MEA3569033.1 LacI family DNA-binding transcriptional regulator [Paenibacillus phoenicis]
MKKATMKDIAREAKVSVATVSYILNNVDNQKITEETRCRVLEAANKLNYIPSLAARSLVRGKSGMVALLFSRGERDGVWKQLYYGRLAERMEALCKQAGYHLLVLGMDAERPNPEIIRQREVDGVLLAGVKQEVFRDISIHFSFGVPIVLLDTPIDDPLFHKVVIDYRKAFTLWRERSATSERRFLVLDDFTNENTMKTIMDAAQLEPKAVFVLTADNVDKLPDFLARFQGGSGIVVNEFVGMIVANASHGMELELTVLCTSGCPELLSPAVRKLTSERNRGQVEVAFEIMQFYIESKDKASQKVSSKTEAGYEEYVLIPLQ